MGVVPRRLVVFAFAMAAVAVVCAAPAAAAILVYEGNSPNPEVYDYTNSSYRDLAAATGDTVTTETTLPADLSGDSCVILQLNQETFSAQQVPTLRAYMEKGGVVVGIGEYYTYPREPGRNWGELADDSLSELAASLGVDLSFQDNELEEVGEAATDDLGPSPFAAGVTSLSYDFVTGVNVAPPAQVVASTAFTETPFIGARSIGSGAFVLLGDSNVLSDGSGTGYETADNALLARNLCGSTHPVTPPGNQSAPVTATTGTTTTTSPASPSPPPAPSPSPPVLGQSADVGAVSGAVLVKLPGASGFVTLGAVTSLPVGTTIDATHGRVRVTMAGPHGGTQTAEFFEGEFVLTQNHAGLVQAVLAGGDFSVCPTARERSHLARTSSSHASAKHVVRKLWTDAHGSFSTRGNYAAATVRGTEWLTEDLCGGTLIHVATDRVAVINRVNHRHVIVKAGHSYLAKAP